MERQRAVFTPLLAPDHHSGAAGRRIVVRRHDENRAAAVFRERIRRKHISDQRTIGEFDTTAGPPHVLVAKTVFGKGVSYMERDYKWHGTPPGTTDMPGEPPKAKRAADNDRL